MRLVLLVAALAVVQVLAGCQTPVRLMPTPVAFSIGDIDPFSATEAKLARTDVPILYATNRTPFIETPERLFTAVPSPQVRVGIAHVRIGENPLDWDTLHRLSLGEPVDQRPIVQLDWLEPKGVLPIDAPLGGAIAASRQSHVFFDMVNRALKLSPGRDVVVYVHGVNNPLPRGVAQAAQFQHFATRRVVVVAFLWPSAGSILRYFTDVGNARASVEPFAGLLQALADNTDARSISVLAYSAGAQIVSPALVRLTQGQGEQTPEQVRQRLRLREIYYAAPDRDTRRFVDEMQQYIGVVGRVTAAINKNDSALRVSQLFNRASRAGRPDANELDETQRAFVLAATAQRRFDLLEVNPATIPDLPVRSHAFWYDHAWVSSDVIALMLLGAAPAERGLQAQSGPDGFRSWSFPADFEQRVARLLAQARDRQGEGAPQAR
jgi:esterase/lipase superfamily enzyme